MASAQSIQVIHDLCGNRNIVSVVLSSCRGTRPSSQFSDDSRDHFPSFGVEAEENRSCAEAER